MRVEDHRPLLDRILAEYGLSPDTLELVPSVQDRCQRHHIEETNPWRAAKCVYSPDTCHIVMCAEQTIAMISSAKTSMEVNGFFEEVSVLDHEQKYLVHLMLHEIACFTLQTSDQTARDEWAFREMKRYVA